MEIVKIQSLKKLIEADFENRNKKLGKLENQFS